MFNAWLREEIRNTKKAIVRDKVKPRNVFEAVIYREAKEQIKREGK